MGDNAAIFVCIDVAEVRNAIAIADGERGGEVRFLGEVDASEESMRRIVKRIAAKHSGVQFCYEAGPTGYGLHRLITSLGHNCIVVAPSLVPRRPGERKEDHSGLHSNRAGACRVHVVGRPGGADQLRPSASWRIYLAHRRGRSHGRGMPDSRFVAGLEPTPAVRWGQPPHSELRYPIRASELDHRRPSGSAPTCARSSLQAAR
jgi:hypothetical protein